MMHIEFVNSKDRPIFVQVDPWACLYKLEKNQTIEIIAPSTSDRPRCSIDECDGDTRILTLLDCDDFFVAVGGKSVHWKEYQTNLDQRE